MTFGVICALLLCLYKLSRKIINEVKSLIHLLAYLDRYRLQFDFRPAFYLIKGFKFKFFKTCILAIW